MGDKIMKDTIACPNCGQEIEVTEVLSAQLTSQIRKEMEADVAERKKQLDDQSKLLADRENEIKKSQEFTKKSHDDKSFTGQYLAPKNGSPLPIFSTPGFDFWLACCIFTCTSAWPLWEQLPPGLPTRSIIRCRELSTMLS